jgi:hypothetical protein
MAKEKKPNPAKDSRTRDGERALAEQRARTDAVNKNTERLRAMRLEREMKQQKDGGRDT